MQSSESSVSRENESVEMPSSGVQEQETSTLVENGETAVLEAPEGDRTPKKKKSKRILKSALKITCVWLLRIVVGGVFIFSGFAKSVDIWGGLYKISDYFSAWGVSLPHEPGVVLACLLSGFEFVLGVMIVTGSYRRVGAWLSALFMVVMTILTLYIWIADPVADCGCFGDALVISNAATFWKNVVLLVLSIALMKYNRRGGCLIRPQIQWIGAVFTCGYVIALQFYGFQIQPLVDYRPFPVGANLDDILTADSSEEVRYVYEKDGERHEFTATNLPEDDSWIYVGRIEEDKPSNESTIAVFDEEDDVTEDLLTGGGDKFVLAVCEPATYGISRSEMANRLYDFAEANDAEMFAIVATNPERVSEWREMTGAQYPVYTAEDTDLKMLVRGEAAIIAIHDGEIMWKTNVFALPPEFPTEDMNIEQIMVIEDGSQTLMALSLVWIIAMVILMVLSELKVSVKMIINKTKKRG